MSKNDKNKEPSFLETVRQVNEKERKEAIAKEAIASLEEAKREEKSRREYEERLKRERLELIKLKQGVISEEDIAVNKPPERHYTIFERISNFFYHNKAYIIVGTLLAGIAIFLIQDYINTERPDIQALYIAADYDMSYYTSDLTELWSGYAQDHNGDGDVIAKLYYVPTGYADDTNASPYLAQSDRTKLLGEFQSGSTIIIIGDKEAYQSIGVLEDVFYDARELFPDDPYAEELGYRLAGTDFKELIGRSDMDDSELYVSFRKPVKTFAMSEEKMQVNFDRAVDFWRNFLSEHRVEGRELDSLEESK